MTESTALDWELWEHGAWGRASWLLSLLSYLLEPSLPSKTKHHSHSHLPSLLLLTYSVVTLVSTHPSHTPMPHCKKEAVTEAGVRNSRQTAGGGAERQSFHWRVSASLFGQ